MDDDTKLQLIREIHGEEAYEKCKTAIAAGNRTPYRRDNRVRNRHGYYNSKLYKLMLIM